MNFKKTRAQRCMFALQNLSPQPHSPAISPVMDMHLISVHLMPEDPLSGGRGGAGEDSVSSFKR